MELSSVADLQEDMESGDVNNAHLGKLGLAKGIELDELAGPGPGPGPAAAAGSARSAHAHNKDEELGASRAREQHNLPVTVSSNICFDFSNGQSLSGACLQKIS